MSLDIIKPRKLVKRSVLLMGPSGTGKTYQFRNLTHDPKNGTPRWKGLYVSAGERYGTIEDLDVDCFEITQFDIPLSPSEKSPASQDFIRMLDYLRTDEHQYEFVFYDSLMGHGEAVLDYLKYTRRLTGFDLWGVFGDKMKMLIKLLTSLTKPQHPKPVHVVATWGVEVGQDWEGKRSIQPLIDGKVVAPKVPYKFDDVIILRKQPLEDGGEQYVAHLSGTHEFDAKVSSGSVTLPPVVADPDLYRIIRKVQGESLT